MNNQKLSKIELYYSPSPQKKKNQIMIEGEEVKHILRVMRHKTGDELCVTNGEGSIYKTSIVKISSSSIETDILQEYRYEDSGKNIYFCLPRLKHNDRFETALEKCTELGITNFVVFESDRSVSQGNKTERWQKIITSAMKQSLRSFLPSIDIVGSLREISGREGRKTLFTQDADQIFTGDIINKNTLYYFIFGPEGDFTEDEKNMFDKNDFYNLGDYRLRSETAIIKCASMISR